MYRTTMMNAKEQPCRCHVNEPKNDKLRIACLCLNCPICNPTRYRNRSMSASVKNQENVQQ